MKTYYTKCGRQFEKSSNAEVTGYHISEEDKQCEKCPFRVEIKEGWPPVFKRWECRAGSEPPNQKNDWRGSLEDKNTIKILSLHNDFLESILEYCKEQTDLSAGYNQDENDCRRVISVSCRPNKKGVAAKKKLIEKFFSNTEVEPIKPAEEDPTLTFDIDTEDLNKPRGKKLSINSALFEVLRTQFDDMLQSVIKQIGGSDDAEITIKLKLAKDYAGDNADELQLSWDITKTIKAKKFKVSGRPQENPIINFEKDGQIVVYEVRQLSLFEE